MLVVWERGLRTNPKTKVDAIAWWIDSGATTHVCKDHCWFKTYEPVEDGYVLYMGDDNFALAYEKGSVVLEFSSGKSITLFNVLYVPKLRFSYYNNGMFMLNLNKVPDDYGSVYMSSSTIVNSSSWHARLEHVHYKRMLEMSKDDLIPDIDENPEKYHLLRWMGIPAWEVPLSWASTEANSITWFYYGIEFCNNGLLPVTNPPDTRRLLEDASVAKAASCSLSKTFCLPAVEQAASCSKRQLLIRRRLLKRFVQFNKFQVYQRTSNSLIQSHTDAKTFGKRELKSGRNQAMVQDGKVVVQDIRGRYNATNQGRPFQRNNARGNGVREMTELQTEGTGIPIDDEVEITRNDLALTVIIFFEADECEHSTLMLMSPTSQTSSLGKPHILNDPNLDESRPSYDSNNPNFRSFFKIKNLEHQIQEKDNVIGHLKDLVTNVNDRSREPHSAVDVTALIEQIIAIRLELKRLNNITRSKRSLKQRPNKTKQIWKPKSKLSDNSLSKTQRVWKATGKLFAEIGHQWRPTGKKLTLGKLDCGSQWRPTGKNLP
ncbi:hypothetical protein Tco_0771080 [Tanacetum coccineum]|uniref:GAG-pre-integrase domain-containing protein n=1 Tax=Tanacetum coccineum TaxID=301880 RepID=A0ABQ4ZE15_9ASTR